MPVVHEYTKRDKRVSSSLGHADWLAMLLDRELVHRQDKRLGACLRYAKLRHQATPEDIDHCAARGLDRGLIASLITGDWIKAHDNLAITGKTGLGKRWLACALGHKACRDNYSVLYVRAPKLFDELALAHGDGSAGRRLKNLAAVQLLILDDWGLELLGPQARHDLLDIFEDRYVRVYHRHQPASCGGLAWRHKPGHLCRRHPRPTHP